MVVTDRVVTGRTPGDSKAPLHPARPNLARLRDRVEPRDDPVTLTNRHHEAARTPAGRRSVNLVLTLLLRRASRGSVFLGRPVSRLYLVLRVRVGVGNSRCSLDSSCRPTVDPQHMTGERRFPPPWTVERAAANLMTKDEARKIAGGIAKLPELLTREAK